MLHFSIERSFVQTEVASQSSSTSTTTIKKNSETMKFLENVKILKVAKNVLFFAKHFRPINILDRLLIVVNLSTAILMLGS